MTGEVDRERARGRPGGRVLGDPGRRIEHPCLSGAAAAGKTVRCNVQLFERGEIRLERSDRGLALERDEDVGRPFRYSSTGRLEPSTPRAARDGHIGSLPPDARGSARSACEPEAAADSRVAARPGLEFSRLSATAIWSRTASASSSWQTSWAWHNPQRRPTCKRWRVPASSPRSGSGSGRSRSATKRVIRAFKRAAPRRSLASRSL